jgi:hypothetical protein
LGSALPTLSSFDLLAAWHYFARHAVQLGLAAVHRNDGFLLHELRFDHTSLGSKKVQE